MTTSKGSIRDGLNDEYGLSGDKAGITMNGNITSSGTVTGNYLAADDDLTVGDDVSIGGNLTTSGNVTYSNTFWDDLRAPFTTVKRGATSKPDFDYTNVGLLFPSGNTAEKIYIIFQLPHTYKLGTNIEPHIHWQQMNSNSVVWKMDYKWFDNGGAVPASFTTITADNQIYSYSSGNLLQIDTFPAIDGSSISSVSSILLIQAYRDDGVDGGAGSNDALAFEMDVHFEVNSPGSQTEYTK